MITHTHNSNTEPNYRLQIADTCNIVKNILFIIFVPKNEPF